MCTVNTGTPGSWQEKQTDNWKVNVQGPKTNSFESFVTENISENIPKNENKTENISQTAKVVQTQYEECFRSLYKSAARTATQDAKKIWMCREADYGSFKSRDSSNGTIEEDLMKFEEEKVKMKEKMKTYNKDINAQKKMINGEQELSPAQSTFVVNNKDIMIKTFF